MRKDCIIIGKFSLCYLLLMNDSNYPWFILVPGRDGVTEIHQLDTAEQNRLIAESSTLSRVIEKLFHADKLNIAALGNMVPQLHVHHIARRKTDAAWPSPVWGRQAARLYTEEQLEDIISKLRQELNTGFEFLL